MRPSRRPSPPLGSARLGLQLLGLAAALMLMPEDASAQTTPAERTLAVVERAFAAQLDRLYAGDQAPTREQELELRRRQVEELKAFVQFEAKGVDRWDGRLLLADRCLELRQTDAAREALSGLDADAAPPVQMLVAADVAGTIGAGQLRDRLIERALGREAPLEQRLEMAQMLMTRLRLVERGEAIFDAALAQAPNDEQRAEVRYYRCEAIREREDLPENSYYDALDQLAKDLPATYWGGIARDRGIASQFTPGAAAVPFTATAVDGSKVELAALRDKGVLLVFWSLTSGDAGPLLKELLALQGQHGEDLHIIGVSVDRDPAAAAAAATALKVGFPWICDGRGWHADLALRYHVEAVPTLIAIDRQGRIAGLNLHADTAMAREDLQAAVTRALLRGN